VDPAGSASITHNEVRYEDNYDEIHLVVSYSFGTLLANDENGKPEMAALPRLPLGVRGRRCYS
jgi:hypothetical protein